MKSDFNRNQVKLPFGLRDGKLVHISEVPSGLACGCICAACGVRLVAKKGKINAHGFAHYRADECAHAIETALHHAAKQVLEESAQIALPELLIHEQVNGETCGRSISRSGSAKVCDEHTVIIEDVKLEQRLGRVIPDVIAYINGSRFLIEIAVTHFVDESKENKLHDLKIPCIEIDLSDVARDADLEGIRKEVVASVINKKWLFHSNAEPVRSKLKSDLQTALQLELYQIYEQEQEKKRKEMELREKLEPSIRLLKDYLKERNNHLIEYRQQLPSLDVWLLAVSSMKISLDSLPDFLNQPVKGESIFACDRRAWQSALFATFIYKENYSYGKSYRVSIRNMVAWCKKSLPLNRFASDLWIKKELLEPDILKLLGDFDLDTAVHEFIRHLEKEGFIKNYFLDYFHLVKNKTLAIDEADAGENNQRFTGISQADFSLLSSDEQEVFLERAGIMEFDGGLSRLEAEKQAYKATLNGTQDLIKERDINYSVVVQARSYCQN